MNLRKEIERMERQIAFTNWLAEKWGLTYEEAHEKQCKTPYAELKLLLKEYENR